MPILLSPLISDIHVQVVLFSNRKSSCCILNLLDLLLFTDIEGVVDAYHLCMPTLTIPTKTTTATITELA